MNESDFGHGAIIHTEDIRDYQYTGRASAPYGWAAGFDVESKVGTMAPENQGGSFSCGGSWAYLNGVQDALGKELPYSRKSRNFVYSQAFVPGGGSDGRVLSRICVSQGACSEADFPSYNADGTPLTEAQYEQPEGITAQARLDASSDRELSYAQVSASDMDAIAYAIEANGGVMLGIYGFNNGTWLSDNPLPPPPNAAKGSVWAHWVYAGRTGMLKGKKAIGILNSWGTGAGDRGWQWLTENYFSSGNVWVCWTMTADQAAIHKPNVQVLPPDVQKVVDRSESPTWTRLFLNALNKILNTNYQ